MPSSTATPMLDKVRQYAKDWGIKIVGDRSGMVGDLRLRPDSYQKLSWTHDGPGIFGIHWPTRKIVEPIATAPKRERVATDKDTWYLIHEISHVLLNVDPEQVDESRSAMLALDYYAGRHLGLGGWEKWMSGFTLDRETLLDNGFTEIQADLSLEWGEIDQATEDLLLSKSLKLAVDAGLLTKQGAPTFNRSAWMPLSMRAEQVALPLARALAAALVEAKRQCG